jgi:hypothetical protein
LKIIYNGKKLTFAFLDPDPDSVSGPKSGSTDLIESGFNSDPDAKQGVVCKALIRKCFLLHEDISQNAMFLVMF